MSEWLDIKYVGLISTRLEKFKILKNNPYTATFRCFACGDSQKNTYKTRGYFISKNGKVAMYCHNCNVTKSISKVLEELDPSLLREYKTEKFIESKGNSNNHISPIKNSPEQITIPKIKDDYLKKLKTISQLPWDHPAKQYIIDRKIPTAYHAKLFYAPRFAKWVNNIIPEKLSDKHDEPRLIIPMLDKNGEMFGFSGRAFHDDGTRYITIMIDDSRPKIFNLDSVNFSERIFVTEGQIDAIFLPNSIAMVGSDLVDIELFNKDSTVMIFDNEARNFQIVKRMDKYIDMGFPICIWPEEVKEKDINGMILHEGLTKEKILSIIEDNIYHGLRAKAQLSKWRKC